MGTHPIYRAGGAERQLHLIGKYLVKKKVDVHYFINKIFPNQKKDMIIDGIHIHTIGILLQRNAIRKNLFQFLNATDIPFFLKNYFNLDFDVYQLRAGDIRTGIWAFFTKTLKKKVFVFTAAHIWDCYPSNRWNNISERIYRYGLQNADKVVVLAKYMKKLIDKNYNINSLVIKSGHNIPPNENFNKEKPPLILWISRLTDWKRPELFLKLFNELKNLDAKFLLIGSGNYKKKEILNYSKKYHNFYFIPGVEQGKDNFYYEKASILVNTSTVEGFPNSFIQAWMYKTPVITLDVDPDCVVCKYKLGVHTKGNFDKLVDSVKEFIENTENFRKIRENCRIYAKKNHDINKTAEQYYKLYKILINNK
ncbi:MAG: glycosyltransferase family 4 protein [Promethearchaeota archaeon]